MLLADLDQRLDDVIEALLVAHGRLVPLGELARAGGRLDATAVLARQQAAGQRAPDQQPEALVDRGRDDLVLGLARLQRVVDLVGDERLVVVDAGDAERLGHLPARVVRAADVADLAVPHERVERAQRLLERRLAVPLVDLVEVDPVRAEPAQAVLAGLDDVGARQAGVVGTVAHREAHLGGERDAVAPALDRLADDLLRRALRVDVGGVHERHARVEAEVDLAPRGLHVELADVGELPGAAEAHGAETQHRDTQS